MSKKKVVITVGGTGGHIFPAIALGKQLMEADASIDLLYVGGNLSANSYFDREVFSNQSIACATFKNKNPWAIAKTVGKIALGIKQSCKILKDYKPDVVVGFGSYYTFPVLLAALMKRIPFIIHEANSIPGKVNRLLSKYASSVGIHFPITASLLRGNTAEVGLPLRPGYRRGSTHSSQAREYFDLDSERFTILIFGGSQGAVKLNHFVSQAFISHLRDYNDVWQIIHLAGDATLAQLLHTAYLKAGIKACVKPFEFRMDLAWQAADMSIARAGAGTIAEQMEFEVPGILVPYPYATDNHQEENAYFLEKIVGGGVKIKEAEMTPELLAKELRSFTSDKLKRMSFAMEAYKKKHRSSDLCTLVLNELKK